jgi:hypothetical protein
MKEKILEIDVLIIAELIFKLNTVENLAERPN